MSLRGKGHLGSRVRMLKSSREQLGVLETISMRHWNMSCLKVFKGIVVVSNL